MELIKKAKTMKNMEEFSSVGEEVAAAALPPPFRRYSGRRLRGLVPASFEGFYRSKLRYCSGARLRSRQINDMYAAWAAANEAPALSMRQVKRAMINIGHAHLTSNGVFFGDVQLAVAAGGIADNYPAAPLAIPEAGLLDRIDRIAVELEQLRREVAA